MILIIQIVAVEVIVYSPLIVAVKTSILLQYVTLLVIDRRNLFHYAVHFLIWTNVLYYFINVFLYTFQVSPGIFQAIGNRSATVLENLTHQSVLHVRKSGTRLSPAIVIAVINSESRLECSTSCPIFPSSSSHFRSSDA